MSDSAEFDRIKHQYQQMIAVRSAELSAHWTRYNIQAVLSSAVLVAFASDRIPTASPARRLVLVAFAEVLALVWLAMSIRGHRWIGFWNRRLIELERRGDFLRIFQEADVETRSDITMTIWATSIPFVFALGWFLAALIMRFDGLPRAAVIAIQFGSGILAGCGVALFVVSIFRTYCPKNRERTDEVSS
jgi:hypothetical protein